jgi:hypothetical protein
MEIFVRFMPPKLSLPIFVDLLCVSGAAGLGYLRSPLHLPGLTIVAADQRSARTSSRLLLTTTRAFLGSFRSSPRSLASFATAFLRTA